MMVQLVNGQKYRLPNGEAVTARQIQDGFLLEYARKSRTPIEVGEDGRLILKGSEMGLTVQNLVPEETEEEKARMNELREIIMMVFDVRDYGGEAWEALQGTVRGIHASAMIRMKAREEKA
jgi:hypothetical protein